MTRRGPARSRGSALVGVLLVAVVALTSVQWGAASPVGATPDLGAARAEARQLRADLDRLESRIESAIEVHNDLANRLRDVTDRRIAAEQSVDSLTRTRDEQSDRTARTARALYMDGGSSALVTAVLGSTDLGAAADHLGALDRMVTRSGQAEVTASRALDSVLADRADLVGLTAAAARLTHEADAARAEIDAARAATVARLARADALVVRLAEEERLRREAQERAEAAAAQARAAARLTALQSSGLGSVTPMTGTDAAVFEAALADLAREPAGMFAATAIRDAVQWVGLPYVAAGGSFGGPTGGYCFDGKGYLDGQCIADDLVGFDCSGLIIRVFAAGGLKLPRISRQQYWAGEHLPVDQARPGDLLFWTNAPGNPDAIHHVAMYLGNGLMVEAPYTGERVRIAAVRTDGLMPYATRPTPPAGWQNGVTAAPGTGQA